jgi:hypothetical protein
LFNFRESSSPLKFFASCTRFFLKIGSKLFYVRLEIFGSFPILFKIGSYILKLGSYFSKIISVHFFSKIGNTNNIKYMLPAGMITFELFVAHMDILLMQNSVDLFSDRRGHGSSSRCAFSSSVVDLQTMLHTPG